jgi:hypothetical protein
MAGGVLGAGACTIGRGVSAVGAWTRRDSNSVLNQARPTGNSKCLALDCNRSEQSNGRRC